MTPPELLGVERTEDDGRTVRVLDLEEVEGRITRELVVGRVTRGRLTTGLPPEVRDGGRCNVGLGRTVGDDPGMRPGLG